MLNVKTKKSDALASRWGTPGRLFPELDATRSSSFQSERLLASDVDPNIFSDECEPGLFGLDCFRGMNEAGYSIDGYVFVAQTVRKLRSIKVGDPIKLTGHVRERRPVKGGVSIVDSFRFVDTSGRVVLESELTGFLIDEVAKDASGDCSDHLVRRDEIRCDRLQLIAEKRLTPDKVRAFSEDVGNIIHFDPDYARKHGFRAPIAQGVMSAVWLLSAMSKAGHVPVAFDVDIRFLRPVFWDDQARLFAAHDAATGTITSAQSRNVDGKATADMKVHWVQYANPASAN